MVTVQHGSSKVLDPVRHRLEAMPDLLRHGPSAVLYGICDAVVDEYEKIADDVEQELEKLETQVFASEGGADAARIYALKRQVVEFRHAVVPLGRIPCECWSAPDSQACIPTRSPTSVTSPITWPE
jgi:magnesium transporter